MKIIEERKILLVGRSENYQLGCFFKNALNELGNDYTFLDESKYFGNIRSNILFRFLFHTLGKPVTYWQFNKNLLSIIQSYKPGIVFICKGSYISPDTIIKSKKNQHITWVNYAPDDPFNPTLKHITDLRKCIPYYEYYFSTKRENIPDLKNAGCPNVFYMPFAYDPKVHFRERNISNEDFSKFASDIVFIGGADLDRYRLIQRISRDGAKRIKIFGNNWNRYFRNNKITPIYGRNYRLALSSAKICLGLVKHSNRDGHSMRSFEIPACGGFMLAERTDEHLELFLENHEMACFESLDELLSKVEFYILNEQARQSVKENGFRKIVNSENTYRHRINQILSLVR